MEIDVYTFRIMIGAYTTAFNDPPTGDNIIELVVYPRRYVYVFSSFKKFSISFAYKRYISSEDFQGLFTNGDCETDPSILITSNRNLLGVRFETQSHSIRVNDIVVREITWI